MEVVDLIIQDIKLNTFDDTIHKVQVHHKFKIMEVLDKHKIFPKQKARMNIPLSIMVSMPMVRPTLKIDVVKMEHAFHMGYREGDKVFYVFATNWQGEKTLVDVYEKGWCEEFLHNSHMKICTHKNSLGGGTTM
jgi:hypothetical protein